MRFFRAERVQKLIREELGKIITRELEFDGALVTIMGVEVDKKMERAKVNVSVVPSSADEEVGKKLGTEAGRLQFLLQRKINIKPMPRIMFAIDHGTENAAAVEKILLRK